MGPVPACVILLSSTGDLVLGTEEQPWTAVRTCVEGLYPMSLQSSMLCSLPTNPSTGEGTPLGSHECDCLAEPKTMAACQAEKVLK